MGQAHGRLHVLFFMLLPARPIYIIHNELVAPLLWVGTIVVLSRAKILT